MQTTNPVLTRAEVHDILWDAAAEHSGKSRDEIRPESRLIEDLGSDSLGVVELAMALEERLGLSIPDESWEGATTMGAIEETLCELLRKRQ